MLRALSEIAGGAKQLDILDVVGAAQGKRQDMIDVIHGAD
jgi:hypothetical protein